MASRWLCRSHNTVLYSTGKHVRQPTTRKPQTTTPLCIVPARPTATRSKLHWVHTQPPYVAHSLPWWGAALAIGAAATATYFLWDKQNRKVYAKEGPAVNYDAIRKEIAALLNSNPKYDDGSYGPVLIRLAWHAAGTYDKKSKTGGSNGATMRFEPESKHAANAGLHVAREILEPIKKRHPEISYADLWTLAGVVAIKEMGGPDIPWRPGRVDYTEEQKKCPPDGRLPDASKGEDHIRDIFYRMGFDDREIVALIGAHAVGRCHKDRSGYSGPWTMAPTMFSNEFYRELLENKWTKKKWNGPEQYEDPSGSLMMLPSDLALIKDPNFRKFVEMYAKDEELWFKDFAKSFAKLLELGVNFPGGPAPVEQKASWTQSIMKSLGLSK